MPDTFHFLTDEDRARLRPSVDELALERFLSASPTPIRRLAILSFVRRITAEDLRDLNERLGDGEANRALDQLLQQPLLPGEIQRPGTPGALAFRTVPTINYVVQLKPPTDPALLALWRPIEPGFTDRDLPEPGAV